MPTIDTIPVPNRPTCSPHSCSDFAARLSSARKLVSSFSWRDFCLEGLARAMLWLARIVRQRGATWSSLTATECRVCCSATSESTISCLRHCLVTFARFGLLRRSENSIHTSRRPTHLWRHLANSSCECQHHSTPRHSSVLWASHSAVMVMPTSQSFYRFSRHGLSRIGQIGRTPNLRRTLYRPSPT